jgi:hypothetical protein
LILFRDLCGGLRNRLSTTELRTETSRSPARAAMQVLECYQYRMDAQEYRMHRGDGTKQ